MSVETLQKAWLAQVATVPIEPGLCFKAQGLVLGAATVLAASQSDLGHASINLEGEKPRLLTLLSSAYGRTVGTEVLGHLRQAADRWREGDQGQADLHLALTRLERLAQPQEAARRLFMADVLMEAGAPPDMIFSALGLPPPDWDEATKLYNPQQPRVPAGNGRVSGQWASAARRLLQNLSRSALWDLASLAARFPAAAVFFGVLFIPTNKTSPQEEYPVPGHPGLRVARLVGETAWRIIYSDQDGDEQDILQRPDGTLRDAAGEIVGRVLPNGHVAIDLAAVAPNHIDNDEPRYCPAPTKDRYGGGPDGIARDYENQVKRYVNPEAPTPDGMGVRLPGNHIIFDDCKHSTGAMIDAKGPGYVGLLERAEKYNFLVSVNNRFLTQAKNQTGAAGDREIRWFFAEKEVADYVRALFRRPENREFARIEIEVLPYEGRLK